MNNFREASVRAVRVYAPLGNSPVNAWNLATADLLGDGTSSQRKGCSRNAFLGLCEEGLVQGFAPGHYTRSNLNRAYALAAVAPLRRSPELSSDTAALWRLVTKGDE